MDDVNIPQTGGEQGWPPAPAPQRSAQPSRSGVHPRWTIGRWAIGRWAIGLGAAIALAGVSVLGLTLSGGSAGGTAQAAGAVLTGNAAAAAGGGSSGGSLPGNAAAARASGFAAASPRLHACIASARHLRAAGHRVAARTRLRACVRRFRRLRAALIRGARARDARLALLLRRAMHGQFTVASKKGPKTIAFERGTVQSVSGGAVVVKAADGVTWTWQVGSDTRLFLAGHRVGAGALAAGRRVAVLGLVTSGTDQARRVLIRQRRAGRP